MPECFKVVCVPCEVVYKCSAFYLYWYRQMLCVSVSQRWIRWRQLRIPVHQATLVTQPRAGWCADCHHHRHHHHHHHYHQHIRLSSSILYIRSFFVPLCWRRIKVTISQFAGRSLQNKNRGAYITNNPKTCESNDADYSVFTVLVLSYSKFVFVVCILLLVHFCGVFCLAVFVA